MKKKLLDVRISCQLNFSVHPADSDVSLTNFPDIQPLLSDLQTNCMELLDLLEAGEIVETDNFELTPLENSLIEVCRFSDTQSPFYLSCDTLRSISDTFSLYDLNEKLLKVGIEFENLSDKLREKNSSNPSKILEPESWQKSFLGNGEQGLLTLDSVRTNKDSANDDTDNIAGYNPSAPVSNFKSIPDNDRFVSLERSARLDDIVDLESNRNTSNGKKLPSDTTGHGMIDLKKHEESDSPSTVGSNVASGQTTSNSEIEKSSEKHPRSSATGYVVEDNVYSNFLDSPREPDDDLPSPELNTIATLKEYLLKKGSDKALSSLKSEGITHKTATNPVFSHDLSFTIGSVKQKFECCTRFARKSDAKRHVEYKACQALGMTWKPGQSLRCNKMDQTPKNVNFMGMLLTHLQREGVERSLAWNFDILVILQSCRIMTATVSFLDEGEFHHIHSGECLNQAEAKRSAAYQACKYLGLCEL